MHLMSVLSDILEEMFAYHRYRLHPGPEYDRLLLKEHRAVCVAIRARDGEAAARAMAEHLDTVLSSYSEDRDPEPDQGPDRGPDRGKDKIRIVSG